MNLIKAKQVINKLWLESQNQKDKIDKKEIKQKVILDGYLFKKLTNNDNVQVVDLSTDFIELTPVDYDDDYPTIPTQWFNTFDLEFKDIHESLISGIKVGFQFRIASVGSEDSRSMSDVYEDLDFTNGTSTNVIKTINNFDSLTPYKTLNINACVSIELYNVQYLPQPIPNPKIKMVVKIFPTRKFS